MRVRAHLQNMEMPAKNDQLAVGQAEPQVLIEQMRKDKKTRHGKLNFILARQMREAFVAGDIDETELNRFLETL